MDEIQKEYCNQLMEELQQALEPIGMTFLPLDSNETQGVPTGIISVLEEGERKGWQLVCNLVPTTVDDIATTYLVLSVELLPAGFLDPQVLEEFAHKCNQALMIGTMLVESGCLRVRYAMVLDPLTDLEPSHFQAAIFAFYHQAERYMHEAISLYQTDKPSV